MGLTNARKCVTLLSVGGEIRRGLDLTKPRTDPRCRDCHVPVEPRQRLCCQCRRLARRKTHRIFMRRWRAKKAGEQSCGVTDAMLGYTGVSAQTARAVMFGPRGGWLKKGEVE